MIAVGQKRWEEQFQGCFDLLFKTISAGIDGKIEGVAEDGKQTWILIGDLVVPTDPKLQKQNRSRFPENVYVESIWGDYTKQNPGKIVMLNGKEQEFYYDSKSWYTLSGWLFPSTTRYDNLQALYSEFLKRCREQYCK